MAEIIRFMRAKPSQHYKITIGTDSELLADGRADFVTAVVVHRIGNGGRYFWRRMEAGPVKNSRASGHGGAYAKDTNAASNGVGRFHTLRDRIIKEVLISLDLGKETMLALKKATEEFGPDFPRWDFEIHADVGENGETKTMIQEVVGMIRAMNFQPITKPGSYAASNVADRHV